MPELTYDHKLSLGDTRHAADVEAFTDDIVPPDVTEVIRAFAAELGPLPPVHVPLRRDDLAVYGWPADGIAWKIRNDGGSIQFGWRLREWPGILLTAEAHAVWVDPDGALVDITRDVADGDISLFVPLPSDSEPFNFDQRPATRYRVLYTPPGRSAAVAERIASMKTSQRAYEERRGRKAGKSLEEWIDSKFHHDPLPDQIAAFIAACDAFDAKLPGLPDLIVIDPDAVTEDDLPPVTEADAATPLAALDVEDTLAEDVATEPTADADPNAASGILTEADDDDLDDLDSLDDDDIDDFEESFDEAWLAAETLEDWSRGRERLRAAILRTIAKK